AIIDGGDDAAIANALFIKRALGCTMVGAKTFDLTNAQGQTETMRWDVPTNVLIYARIQLAIDVDDATKGQIQVAIEAHQNALADIGADATWFQTMVAINQVPGLSVAAVYLGTAPNPPTPNVDLVINYNQIARWNVARIDVGV